MSRSRPRTLLLLASLSLASLSVAACSKGSDIIPAKQAATDAEKYKGKKIKVSGVYVQGFSKGGRPTDPWVLVIGDGPAVRPTMNCIIPAKVELSSKYPKITAEGTVSSDGTRVYLEGCTYKVE